MCYVARRGWLRILKAAHGSGQSSRVEAGCDPTRYCFGPSWPDRARPVMFGKCPDPTGPDPSRPVDLENLVTRSAGLVMTREPPCVFSLAVGGVMCFCFSWFRGWYRERNHASYGPRSMLSPLTPFWQACIPIVALHELWRIEYHVIYIVHGQKIQSVFVVCISAFLLPR